MTSTERILNKLYFFLALTSTFCQEIYQESDDLCQKCTCHDDGKSVFLNCTDKGFQHMIADWPSSDKPIRAIFTGNNFTDLQTLPSTTFEVEIVLSRCGIRTVYPSAFGSAVKTKSVDLSYNLLTSEEFNARIFRGSYVNGTSMAIGIERLNLAYNQLHSLHKDVFAFLPNLTVLNLEGNDFKLLDVLTQLALGKLTKLTDLNLANNELTELIPDAIRNLSNLIVLNLSKNDLDFVPYDLNLVGQTLQVLNLDFNPIYEMAEDSFTNLTQLKEISANNLHQLRKIKSNTFAGNLKLVKLSLCNNTALEEIDSKAFSPRAAVEEVYLNNNGLLSLSEDLLNWTTLDVFEFKNNPLVCSCELYRIGTLLPKNIESVADDTTCVHPRLHERFQVYNLQDDICVEDMSVVSAKIRYQHWSIPMAGLFVILATALGATILVGYKRYRRFLPQPNNSFVSQVIYTPLLNNKT